MTSNPKTSRGARPRLNRNDNPYDAGPLMNGKKLAPSCVYFYYIGPDPNNDPYVREYYYSVKSGTLEMGALKTELEKLTKNARIRTEADQVPPPIGSDWKRMVWYRKCYIVILIDDPSFVFEQVGVAFDTVPYNTKPNHSFYDAWNDWIDAPLSDGVKRLCPMVGFINHMKTEAGPDLDKTAERFHFSLLTKPPLIDIQPPAIGSGRIRGRYPDSGGTNMGPPVPPP